MGDFDGAVGRETLPEEGVTAEDDVLVFDYLVGREVDGTRGGPYRECMFIGRQRHSLVWVPRPQAFTAADDPQCIPKTKVCSIREAHLPSREVVHLIFILPPASPVLTSTPYLQRKVGGGRLRTEDVQMTEVWFAARAVNSFKMVSVRIASLPLDHRTPKNCLVFGHSVFPPSLYSLFFLYKSSVTDRLPSRSFTSARHPFFDDVKFTL